MKRTRRRALLAGGGGVLHAAVVVGVALRLGYDVGPTPAAPLSSIFRFGGFVALGALPVWLALEDRLVTPLLLLGLLAGLALYWELTPPGPTFQDLAELEPNVDGPTGYTVVSDGLYLTAYLSAWYAWLAGVGLAGLWEHVVRAQRRWLPDPGRDRSAWANASNAGPIAAAAGVVHAVTSVGIAARWGMTDSSGVLAWAAVGGVLAVGIPVYLLLRYELAWPAAIAIAAFLNSVHSQQYASGPGDPHALYVGAWFVFLGIALLAGALEYGARRTGERFSRAGAGN